MKDLAKIIYDTYKGEIPEKYSKASKSEREEAIRTEIFGVLGITKYEKKAFRKAWRKHKNEVYEIIEELANQVMVDGEYQKSAFYEKFVEVRNLALGDTAEFYVEGQNELIVSEFSGSHFDLRRTRVDVGQSFTPEMKDYGVKVFEYFERILSGRASIETLITHIVNAVDEKLKALGEATFMSAVENLPVTFKISGTYDEGAILTKLAHVEASNKAKPTLVGTATALAKLQGKIDVAVWSEKMKDDKNSKGFIPVWNGYECLEISQGHKLGTFDFTMSPTKVYGVCGDTKIVKLLLEGDTESKEISDGTDNADRSLENAISFKAGAAVAYNKMLLEIDLA